MKKIFVISGVIITILISCLLIFNKQKEENKKLVSNTDGMLSYTIDGEIAKEQPSKENGYIVNKIECKNGSILVWDNDNWQVELVDIKSADRCMVDFTKDTTREGYRVTVTSNGIYALDSTSKTTVNGGTVTIYPKGSTIASVTGCSGVLEDNKVIVRNVTENQTCNITIDSTLASAILAAYPPKSGRTDFSVYDQNAPALYTDEDDQGTTYYFSGDGSKMNNWVNFAGKMWRIIRINGNGSVRLLYAGNGTDATDIGKIEFNSMRDDPMYVGWKYGTSGSLANNRTNENSSTIYSKVETWYNTLSDTNKVYLDSSAIYCNDRELASENSYSTSSKFYYAVYERVMTTKSPTFKCANARDVFTGNNSIPVGLMTVDEVMYAGGTERLSNRLAFYYLARDGVSSITGSDYWWTMSSSYWYECGDSSYASGVAIFGEPLPGRISEVAPVYHKYVIRPVISLKSTVQVTGGNGTSENPYIVTYN